MKGTPLLNSLTVIYKAFYNKIKNPNSVLWQVSTVAGGTLIAQVLNVFVLPVLSRIYSPADFGVMAVYSSIIAILSEISGLRYYLAIPLPKQSRYAHALVCLSFLLQIAVVVLLSIILSVCGDQIFHFFSIGVLIQYKYLLPAGLFSIGLYNIVSQWAIRESLFSTLGRTKISQCISGTATKVILGYYGLKPLGLLLGTVIGQAGGVTTLLRSLLKKSKVEFNKANIKRVLIKYRAFPIYNTCVGFLNTFGLQLPQIFLTGLYGIRYAGLYAMASSLLNIPAAFIGQAIGQVFLQKASVARYSGNIDVLSFKTYILLLQIGFFPILMISMLAPSVLVIFLGQKWSETGYYAIALSPWIAYIFSVSHLGNIFIVLNLQKQAFIFEFLYIAIRILAFVLSKIWFNSPLLSVALFSLSNCAYLLCKILYMFKQIKVQRSLVLSVTFKIIAESLILCIIVKISFIAQSNILVVLSVILTSVIYSYRTYKHCRFYGLI